MKRLSGSTLALAGLVIGISVGLAISLFKEYLINEIVQAMEEEISASCDCSVTFDSFNLSFTTLSGRAQNVRILEKGVPKLSFDKITATFSLGQITSKIISIDNLVLSNGYANGVGPKSVTFRFIDQLTTPPPPEQADPTRWRAILNHLEVKDSRFREPLGETSELTATGVALQVDREGENFRLHPSIKDLRYKTMIDPEIDEIADLPLGSVDASVVIEDTRAIFESLTVGRGASSLELNALVDTKRDDALQGTAHYSLDARYIDLPEWLSGQFSGDTTVRGSLGSPILSGSISNQPGTPLTFFLPHSEPLSFNSLKGEITVDVNHGDPIVTLKNLSGTGERSTITGSRALTYSKEGLDAGFSVLVPSFTYGPFTVKDARASVSVTPLVDDIHTEITLQAGDLKVEGTSLGPVSVNIDLEPTTVKTKVESTDPRVGSFHWEGEIDISSPDPELRQGVLTLTNYRLPLQLPVNPNKLSPAAITTKMTLSGLLDLASLRGEGPTTIAFPSLPTGMPLSGVTTLRDGLLEVSLPESAYQGSALLKLDVARSLNGELRAKLPPSPFSRFVEHSSACGQLDASLIYNFNLLKPFAGSGSLGVGNLFFGCEPYTLHFTKNASLPIVSGALQFKDVAVTGVNSSLGLIGSVGFEKGFDINLEGQLFLSAFLPFMSGIDDLQGKLDTHLSIKGPVSTPLFGGRARLTGGEFGLASPEVEAHDAQGTFLFTGNSIRIETLTGAINNGTFDIQGNVLPFDLSASSITTRLNEVTIEPIEDSVITFSGDLTLGTAGKTRQTLSGRIKVDFAEIERNFDINQILVRTLTGYFIPSRIQPRANTTPINLDLDISIEAPRNIFVFTPFFTAELSAAIQAQGTVAEPSLSGGMHVLSGWVGLKDNRFDITNGNLTFKPGSFTPHVEIASEGALRTSTGESILVILEASGPLPNPRITLSSDRGLSHDELLVLLTSSRSFGGQTLANRTGMQFAKDQRFFLSEDTFSSVGAFFRNLTHIETLSLEPIYNPFTGSIEPALVGKKNISSRLALVGNSTFSTLPNSRAGVVYNLTPSVNVSGFLQSMPSRKQAALSSDLTYTILSEQSRFVDLQVEGLSAFERESILASAHLGLASRVRNTSEALGSIHRNIVQYMNQQGFLSARATVECLEGEEYCSKLRIIVEEGPLFTIRKVVFTGPLLPVPAQDIVEKIVTAGDSATTSVLDEVERRLVIALRHEGYISARVSPKYEFTGENSTVDIVVGGESRQPISFVFTGNTVFSASEFLDSIQLFSRKRPFGNNTINLLVQNIERMYQDRGYLFARVSFREDRSDPARLTYRIAIAEEDSIPVRKLDLEGNAHLGLGRIKQIMKELGFAEEVELLKPNYAIPDQLDALREILISAYNQEGYPNATVRYEITPTKSGSALDITFVIDEGEPSTINSLSVIGFPSDVREPIKPKAPTSLPRTNRFIQQLIDTLSAEGFLYPAVTTDLDPSSGELEITAVPGTRIHISEIEYEGLSRITGSVAIEYTTLKAGSPYRNDDVNETKHKLLRSGLFSRVEVLPADGTLDSGFEALIIRVAERPLQTLEVGGGANSELGVHVFGEAIDKSLFSDGRSLALRLDSYFDQTEVGNSQSITQGFASLRYMDPSFLDSEYTLTEDLRYQRQDLPTQEWNLDRTSLASYALRHIGSGVSLSAGHTFLLDDLYDVTPGAIISDLDQGTVRLSFLSALLSIDRRDDPLLPRSGYTFAIEPKLSTNAFGSEATYALVNANASGVIPLDSISRRFSLGLRLLGGFAEPFGPTDEIPITQRFYLGGRTTIRGFRQNALGPRGSDGAIIGGDTLLGGNTQFQYLVADTISTHIFFDFGNVFLREMSSSLTDLRTSTGVGFRYLSPIGPIGFDVGAPLDEREGEPSVRIHFSVGSTF